MRKNVALIITVIGIALLLGVFLLRGSKPLSVWLYEVSAGTVETTVANTRAGTIKACRRSRLSMPIGGVVDSLHVTEGQQVEKGQLLLELWNRDRLADVTQSGQTLAAAQHDQQSACLLAEHKEREAKRIEALRKRKLASDENLDVAQTASASQSRLCEAAKNKIGVASARQQLAEAVLEQTRLHAPFAGIVAEINGEVGEYITPSPPGIPTPAAVDLIDYTCLYVAAPIDEIDASAVALGLPARITLDAYRERDFVGVVSRIAPYVLDLERQARTVEVEVRIDTLPDDVKLLVGYSADMTIVLDRHDNVLRVPTEAVQNGNSVWVVDSNNQLQRRQISIGLSNWSFSEVTSGLKAGDRIVRSPDLPGLGEGIEVRAQNSNDDVES